MTEASSQKDSENIKGIVDVLAQIEESTREQETISVGDLLEAFDDRTYGPLLLALSVIVLSPIGGIPGLPTLFAVLIGLVAVQCVLGMPHPWLPRWFKERDYERAKVTDAFEKITPYAEKVDRLCHARWSFLARPPGSRIASGVCLVLCGLMPLLEVIPFGVMLPAAGLCCLSLGLTARDGLWLSLGYGFVIAAASAVFFVVM